MQRINHKLANINFVRFFGDQIDHEVFRIQILLDDADGDSLLDSYKLIIVGGEFNDVILVSNISYYVAKTLLLFIAEYINNKVDLRKVVIHCVTHDLYAEFNTKHQLSRNFVYGELNEPFLH